MKYVFHSLICMILLSSCKNDGGTSDPTLSNQGFQGITQTVDSPTPVGWIDPDDWKNDGYWNTRYPNSRCTSPELARQSPPRADTSVHPIETPVSNKLYPAYPNPCNPRTSIRFDLAQSSGVYIAMIDDHYRVVAPIVCATHQAGIYEVTWDGKDTAGKQVSGGVYRAVFLVTNQQGGLFFASHGDVWVKY